LPVGVENVGWTTPESILAQVNEDFQDILPSSVRAGDCNELFLAKLLSPPSLSSALLKQSWISVCKFLCQQFTVKPCSQVNFESSRLQDHMDGTGERCSDGGVGNAFIHHSTIAACDHTHASYVDSHFARVTHRLYPRGMELSMFAMRIWRCIDYLHLHLHV
jgi:hypothetical protein